MYVEEILFLKIVIFNNFCGELARLQNVSPDIIIFHRILLFFYMVREWKNLLRAHGMSFARGSNNLSLFKNPFIQIGWTYI